MVFSLGCGDDFIVGLEENHLMLSISFLLTVFAYDISMKNCDMLTLAERLRTIF